MTNSNYNNQEELKNKIDKISWELISEVYDLNGCLADTEVDFLRRIIIEKIEDFNDINRLLDDLSHVEEGSIVISQYEYIQHFADYFVDIETILSYRYGADYLKYFIDEKLIDEPCAMVEFCRQKTWEILINDFRYRLAQQ